MKTKLAAAALAAATTLGAAGTVTAVEPAPERFAPAPELYSCTLNVGATIAEAYCGGGSGYIRAYARCTNGGTRGGNLAAGPWQVSTVSCSPYRIVYAWYGLS